MYLPADQPAIVLELIEQYHRSINNLSNYSLWQGKTINLLPGADARDSIAKGQLALVASGLIYVNRGEKTAFILQQGDIFFHFGVGEEEAFSYIAEETSSLTAIDNAQLIEQFTLQPRLLKHWHHFLLLQTAIFSHAYAANMKQGVKPAAGFQRFSEGDIIIQEGDTAEHVYTLLKGEAMVTVESITVGKVKEGEIFGALAAISGEPRNATILARSNCTIMTVPKDQFIELIKSHPETCLQMIQTMALQIAELNRRVSGPIESAL